jgi:hypothetical protein
MQISSDALWQGSGSREKPDLYHLKKVKKISPDESGLVLPGRELVFTRRIR